MGRDCTQGLGRVPAFPREGPWGLCGSAKRVLGPWCGVCVPSALGVSSLSPGLSGLAAVCEGMKAKGSPGPWRPQPGDGVECGWGKAGTVLGLV